MTSSSSSDNIAVELENEDGSVERYPFEALGRFTCAHCSRSCLGGYIYIAPGGPLSTVELVRTLVIHDEPYCAGFESDPRTAEAILTEARLWPPPDLNIQKVIPS